MQEISGPDWLDSLHVKKEASHSKMFMLGRYRTQGNKQYLFEHVQLKMTTNQKMREQEKQGAGERAECFSSQNRKCISKLA